MRRKIILNKKLLSYISSIFAILVIVIFFIWAFTVQEPDGTLDIFKYKKIVITFIVLVFMGGIFSAIEFAGIGEKSSKVRKKSVIVGLTMGISFLVWRLLMGIF